MTDQNRMMRLDIRATLTVLSALHIGNGEICDPDQYPEIDAQVSAIQRGGKDRVPYIPGSALKGALRETAIAVGMDVDLFAKLFGEVLNTGSGMMGALLVRGSLRQTAGDASTLPFANNGVFVSARTAINDGVGVSDQNKLFFAEAVAPDTVFPVRLRLETRGDITVLEKALLEVLAIWTKPEGVAIGADQASGLGRVRLSSQVEIVSWDVMSRGQLATTPKRTKELDADTAQSNGTTIELFCKGPYLSRDPSWNEAVREKAKTPDKPTPPHIRAIRRNNLPYLTGQSVSGALRARQEWLEKLKALKGKAPLPDPVETLLDKSAAIDLRPSERLFGVAGWRGVLRVMVLETGRRQTYSATSVKIDRFSGGPIDNALFSTDADYGITTKFELSLDHRATDEDEETLNGLLAEIKANGLQLGQGVNHGFGWFEVEK